MARATRRYQEVAEGLRALIEQGGYAPGDRILTERQIAENLQVGRSAAREAILLMEIEGMLEVRKGSGIYLKAMETSAPKGDANDIGPFELIQARQLLESAVAGLAASTVTKADIIRMRDALELERNSIATGAQDYSGDELFHRLIAEATQNNVLVDTVNELWKKREASRMWARLHDRIFVTDYRLRWLDDHSAILAALQRRDPEAARSAMWQHLENVRVTLLELSDDEDPGFDGYLFDSREVSKVFR
ncbi:FCD domain-containing protein [Roseinatronobacter alkalisoli]|uniref:FCD domain-containing protein n=1 Tax=Roseinatronobacter alkalisoli TaxID=3028235 RepID=A0ABT5T7E9_9RHOB|nr:FCD domain-containing protein [Roseinatronobacter sp. HJB301]MDD7971048.1 FCD domain-containing protein [Roseinatronobacter sp. HJB301]